MPWYSVFDSGRKKVPLILQTEVADCGLACIAMIASFFGRRESLSSLRQRFSLSLKGTNLLRLLKIANQLGLDGRALRVELDHLSFIETPCILHWNLTHFVVLKKASSKQIHILDPARGEITISLSDASKHFTGIVLQLSPTSNFEIKKSDPPISLSQLTGPIKGLMEAFLRILTFSFTLQLFALATPLLMQWTVDQVLVSSDFDLMYVLGGGFMLCLLFQTSVSYIRGRQVIAIANSAILQWMSGIVGHLLRLPLEFFEKRHLGDIISRIGSARSIQQSLSTSFLESIVDGVMAISTFSMMLFYNWELAFITLAAVCLYGIFRFATFRPIRRTTEQQLSSTAVQQSHLLESVRGVQSLKVAGREDLRRIRQCDLIGQVNEKDVRLAIINLNFVTTSQIVFGVERILVISIGAYFAIHGGFSAGMLIAYIAYKDQFVGRINSLIDKGVDLRMMRLHVERLADVLISPPEIIYSQSEFTPRSSRIDVNVSFRYAEGEPWILKDCSFSVQEGESVAIVGPSGCGKTTLIKVLLGLLTPEHGSVSIDGQSIASIGISNYRSVLGAVMQEDQLFSGTIAENIAFFDDSIDQDKVEAAADIAAIHREIIAMPMGYQSLIGDMGSTLSGGQKQRIILARALYRDPKILFLDEATSHLDVKNEKLINDSIRNLKITKIIVAHRPETILSADRILTLRDGSVVRPEDLNLAGLGNTPTTRHT